MKPQQALDIFVQEVTPLMRIEGACVLGRWQDGDEDLVGLSLQSLAGMIYSCMRLAQEREKSLADKQDMKVGKRRPKDETPMAKAFSAFSAFPKEFVAWLGDDLKRSLTPRKTNREGEL